MPKPTRPLENRIVDALLDEINQRKGFDIPGEMEVEVWDEFYRAMLRRVRRFLPQEERKHENG